MRLFKLLWILFAVLVTSSTGFAYNCTLVDNETFMCDYNSTEKIINDFGQNYLTIANKLMDIDGKITDMRNSYGNMTVSMSNVSVELSKRNMSSEEISDLIGNYADVKQSEKICNEALSGIGVEVETTRANYTQYKYKYETCDLSLSSASAELATLRDEKEKSKNNLFYGVIGGAFAVFMLFKVMEKQKNIGRDSIKVSHKVKDSRR